MDFHKVIIGRICVTISLSGSSSFVKDVSRYSAALNCNA